MEEIYKSRRISDVFVYFLPEVIPPLWDVELLRHSASLVPPPLEEEEFLKKTLCYATLPLEEGVPEGGGS